MSNTDLESNLIWKVVAPLAVACILAAGGSVFSSVRLSVVVDNLQASQAANASEEWVNGQIRFVQYQIDQMQNDIASNVGRIQNNRDDIRLYHPTHDALWRVPYRRGYEPPLILRVARS